jgi:predicted nucleotidyltransferase
MISPVSTKKDLVERILSHKSEIQNFGVKKLSLFGSFVRDEATTESDVDLLVEMPAERKRLKNFMGLIYYLEEITGRSVEVVTPQGLSPYIGPHILKTVEDVFAE